MTPTDAPADGGADGMADGMAEAMRVNDSLPPGEEVERYWAEGAAAVAAIVELTYPGADGQRQALRLYRGNLPAPAPVLVYIHGGGWVGGSIALNESAVRALVAESGWSAVSIAYRLAPQHPFPAALDDVRAALAWLRDTAPGLGLDTRRIALGGASAGANLAAATALVTGGQGLAALILFYGVFGVDLDTDSYHRHAKGPGLTRGRMAECLAAYDPGARNRSNPGLTPLAARDLGNLPPAFVVAAERDVLSDDSRRFAARIAQDGGAVEMVEVAGVTHGFINRGRLVPAARGTLSRAARFLAAQEARA